MFKQSAKMFKSQVKDGKQPVHKSLFWGIRCESGKKYSQIVNQKFHISMAALDPISVQHQGNEIISLVVEREGSEFLLCNLQNNSALQVNLNLFFDKGEKVVFSLKGKGIVHLTGYLLKDDNYEIDGPLQSKNLNDSIMLAKDKVKTSANKNVQFKNISTENDSWKVESKEIASPTKKLFASPSKKNSKTNVTGVFEDNWNVESEEDKSSVSPMKSNASPIKKSVSLSPTQNPTPQKKLFGPPEQESEDSSEEETSDDDDENAKQLLRFAQKRPISTLEDEDEDSETDDSSDESDNEVPVKKQPQTDLQSSKKLKAEASTPLPGKKPTKNVTEVIDIDEDSKNGDMNSSIGRTPMPKKKPESVLQKNVLIGKSLKAKLPKDKDSSDSDEEIATPTGKLKETDKKSGSQMDTSGEALASEKKKKKKNKKTKANVSTVSNESSASVNESALKASGGDLSKAKYSKKLGEGLAYEDLRIGNGPIAKKGRVVYVHYTGKLENNTVFDSCKPGKDKPFSFKLGAGQVIKGWDLSVEGMKVGGKRRIKIPPNMAYKNQQTGPIPPNSTLYFIVELKAVS